MKIYNVKMSKTEMACAPPKSCRNQKSFWDPSTYHPNTTGVGWIFLLQKNMFWWDTLACTEGGKREGWEIEGTQQRQHMPSIK